MKKRKQILISQNSMPIGGAEKALIAMLESFDYSRFEVDLFLYNHTGELLKDIPTQVHILPENRHYIALSVPLVKSLKFSWRAFCVRILAKISTFFYSRGKDNYTIYDEIDRWGSLMFPRINPQKKYDGCISYLANHHMERNLVNASKYIAWIHTDYSSINFHKKRSEKGWSLFDHIISISDSTHAAFANIFPALQYKLVKVENLIYTRNIKQQAAFYDARKEMHGTIKLLSIGRYCYQKNFTGAVEIMAALCKLRKDAVWYIIGFGSEENLIRKAIEYYGMQEHFILLGKRENPYPYIAACDLYIQPSLYEGKSIAVQEAQVMCKPVAITNYQMASSQLDDGIDGCIIPMNPTSAALAIHELLNDPQKMASLSYECSLRDYSKADELSKLYALI